MIRKIDIDKLKIGMYIILSESWFRHPFMTGKFLISTEEQLDKIHALGLSEVEIDTSKSRFVEEVDTISHPEPFQPPEKWEPEKLLSDSIRMLINDKSIDSETKASAIYVYSLDMMKEVMDTPTYEVMKDVKKGISCLVDLILSDDETTENLLNIVSHDFYTYTHSVNVGILSIMLSKKLFINSDDHDLYEMGAGFFLHDIGKLRINPAIINKQGKLTDEEMQEMRSHPYQGYKILKETGHLSDEADIIVLQHHEREDGTGYPRRLKGNDIHVYGRICCIADVFDALTAERSYKTRVGPFDALKIMKEDMIDHFQKDVFEKFVLLFS